MPNCLEIRNQSELPIIFDTNSQGVSNSCKVVEIKRAFLELIHAAKLLLIRVKESRLRYPVSVSHHKTQTPAMSPPSFHLTSQNLNPNPNLYLSIPSPHPSLPQMPGHYGAFSLVVQPMVLSRCFHHSLDGQRGGCKRGRAEGENERKIKGGAFLSFKKNKVDSLTEN